MLAACRPMAYLASEIGSDGGANSGKSVAGLSSARTRHERQLGIDLRHQLERGTALGARLQHLERGVGVAGEAVARHAIDHAFGHELRHHVEAGGEQIGHGVGVIRRDVVLLRLGDMQPSTGKKEELDHADVRWKLSGAQRRGIGEIGIAAEQPIDHRRDEARFQQIAGLRLLQRQRREEGQVDRTVGACTRVERVDDVVGLAEPERQSHHELPADIADDVIGDRFGIGENFRHQSKACEK
jgi:hypothetical protein